MFMYPMLTRSVQDRRLASSLSWPLLSIVLILSCTLVHSFPTGAPPGVCVDHTPVNKGSPHINTGGIHTFVLTVSPPPQYTANGSLNVTAGSSLNVTLSGSTQFRGFLISVVRAELNPGEFNVDGGRVGNLSVPLDGRIECNISNSSSSITHNNNTPKSSINTTWTAPASLDNITQGVTIWATIVVAGAEVYRISLPLLGGASLGSPAVLSSNSGGVNNVTAPSTSSPRANSAIGLVRPTADANIAQLMTLITTLLLALVFAVPSLD